MTFRSIIANYKPGDVLPPTSYGCAGIGLVVGQAERLLAAPPKFNGWSTFWLFLGVFGFIFIIDALVQLLASGQSYVVDGVAICNEQHPFIEGRSHEKIHWIHPHVQDVSEEETVAFYCPICGKTWKADV